MLSACQSATPSPAVPADGGAEPADNGAAPAEGGTLSLWTWKVAMQPGFREAGELYAAKSGFNVEVEAFTPDDTYRQKVIAAANSGDLPDVIHWWATRGYGFENALVNMTSRVDDAYKAKFNPAAFDESIVRPADVENWANNAEVDNVRKGLKAGDIYQIPLDVGGFFTIYANNEILAQVGLEDKVPENFDQFVEYAKKVADETDKGGFVFAGGLPDVYYNWMGRAIEATYLGAEGSVDIINRRAKMSDNIEPLKAFERLCQSGAILDGSVAMDIDAGDMAFAAGEAAYLLGGTFTFGQLSAMGMDVNNVFSFLTPMISGSKVTEPFELTPFPLTAMMVSNTSQHQEAAMGYIDYIVSDPEGAATFANGAYCLPAYLLDSATISKLSPALQSMYNGLSTKINITSVVDNWPEGLKRTDNKEYELLYADMQQMMMGALTAEQAAANFDANAAAQAAAGQ
jgi:multiple sugar transport system substrate-binding protein